MQNEMFRAWEKRAQEEEDDRSLDSGLNRWELFDTRIDLAQNSAGERSSDPIFPISGRLLPWLLTGEQKHKGRAVKLSFPSSPLFFLVEKKLSKIAEPALTDLHGSQM